MNVFQRVENKYLIDINTYKKIVDLASSYGFSLDEFGRSTIQTLYYDTPLKTLIRRSIDKPVFKEKIRVRNYGEREQNKVYLEIKRKFKSTVYKRRIETTPKEVERFFQNSYTYDGQIGKEINSFRNIYKKLVPSILIHSLREAFHSDSSDLRITFDFNIKYDYSNFSFNPHDGFVDLIDDNQVLLEIKTKDAYPLWLTKFLCDNKIFKTSFSKYGASYIETYMRYINE